MKPFNFAIVLLSLVSRWAAPASAQSGEIRVGIVGPPGTPRSSHNC